MVVSFISIVDSRAQTTSPTDQLNSYVATSTAYLQQIAANTYGTLVAVNNIPVYLNELTLMALSWLALDNDPSTSIINQTQQSFASLAYWTTQDYATQNSMQQQMMADMLHKPLSDLTTPPDNPPILASLPNVNDLSYATILGMPPVAKGTVSPYNYVKNASGITVYHVMPGLSWSGKKEDRDRYAAYYNTIMSVASYNGYILSNFVAENQNGNQLTTLQNQLITQASSSSWLAQVATEELGKVLREILLFESQSYVVMTQLMQLERQILAAHAMTNSLLLLYGQINEGQLVNKAQAGG